MRDIAVLLCLAGIGLQTVSAREPSAPPMHESSLRIDACALLRPTDIGQIVGLPVAPGVRHDDGLVPNGSYSSSCIWEVRARNPVEADRDKPLGGKSFVILNVQRWPPGSGMARTFLESFRAAAADGTIAGKPIARDFGDEALWWGDGLAVRSGDVSFGISVFLPRAEGQLEKGVGEERLAPLVLRRLEHRIGSRSEGK